MEFEDIKETGNPEKYMSKIISMVVWIQCALLGLNIALHKCIGCLLLLLAIIYFVSNQKKKFKLLHQRRNGKSGREIEREREKRERVWVYEGECECHREKEREKE